MAILSVVSRISGCDVLIDSSKAASRAWMLAAHADPTIIHLRRACKDFLASAIMPKYDPGLDQMIPTRGFAYSAMSWLKAEHSNRLLSKRTPVQRISYEAFAFAPRSYLSRELGSVFPDLIKTIAWVDDFSVDPAAEYHSIGGNLDRYSRERIFIRLHSGLNQLRLRERSRCLIGGAVLTLLCG
jgi:hypothetical protein